MTQHSSIQQPGVCYVARVYLAPSGQWAFAIKCGTEPYCSGAGYASGDEAETALYEVLPRPYSLFLEHLPEHGMIYGPVLDGAA